MKEIVIDISEDGEIRLETKGFVGKACVEESQFLKDIPGKETFKRLCPGERYGWRVDHWKSGKRTTVRKMKPSRRNLGGFYYIEGGF